MSKEIVYAFIDGQNLHKAVEKFLWFFCYDKFFNLLVSQYNVSKAYYFIGLTKNRNNILYQELRSAGFQLCLRKPIIYKENKCSNCTLMQTCQNYNPVEYERIKANVDSNLTIGVMSKINEYDNAVIVAGDSDYYYLAKFLLRQNKLKKILLPSKKESSDLYKDNKLLQNKIEYISRKSKFLAK